MIPGIRCLPVRLLICCTLLALTAGTSLLFAAEQSKNMADTTPKAFTLQQIKSQPESVIRAFLNRNDGGFSVPEKPEATQTISVTVDTQKIDVTQIAYTFTSQRWLEGEAAGVNYPLWKHRLTLFIPTSAKSTFHSDHAIFYIDGGTQHPLPGSPAQGGADALDFPLIAARSGQITIHLEDIPNQYLQFKSDRDEAIHRDKVSPGGAHGFYKEDDLIAYTWKRFVESPEENTTWPLQLPMLKAAIKGMDVAQTLISRHTGTQTNRFIVSGLSKRGWVTWLTAAFDPRVVAIMPGVIEVLNTVPSMQHQYQAYAGHWAPAVASYKDLLRLLETDRSLSPEQSIATNNLELLLHLVDPYTYKDQITQPKLILSTSSDDFFLPDSWRFFLNELKGETHIQVLPNNPHYIVRENAPAVTDSLTAFSTYIARNLKMPDITWNLEQNRLTVSSDRQPGKVIFWQANNKIIRDFRINRGSETSVRYTATDINPACQHKNCSYIIDIPTPSQGWTAAFVEMIYADDGLPPMTLSTPVFVSPDTYPGIR